MKKIYLLASMISLVMSCSKAPETSLESDLAPKNISKSAAGKWKHISPLNADNPADSIGRIHNIVLDSVYAYIKRTGDTSKAGKSNEVVRYFRHRYGEGLGRPPAEISILIQKHQSTPADKKVLSRYFPGIMASYLSEMISYTNLISRPEDYLQFKSAIVRLEGKIIREANVSEEQRSHLLHVASICRHSLWYWMNAIDHGQNQQTMGFLRNFIRAFMGSHADMHMAIYLLLTFSDYRHLLADAAGESAGALWYFDAFF